MVSLFWVRPTLEFAEYNFFKGLELSNDLLSKLPIQAVQSR